MKSEKGEKIPLSQAVTHVLEECRMVLPGIQALFGFQLIVVFNPSFSEKLSLIERWLHLTAIGLIIIAIASKCIFRTLVLTSPKQKASRIPFIKP